MSDEDDLDDEQRAAVEAVEKAIAVLAGPGSGKTRTLCHRARHLLKANHGDRALLLTFTNKAAAEMKSRAIGTAAVSSDRIDAGTFHGFGVRMLRSHGSILGVPADFEILDEEESKALARAAAASAGLENYFAAWQKARLRRLNPTAGVAAFGAAYQEAKFGESSVDFDDLVALSADLLETRPDIAEAYGNRYAHLLIDEFQDTNAAQFAIVRALSTHCSTVSVFADDDQAIFRFVGADVANIRGFVDELKAEEYPLTVNYRSRERIVEVANTLIAADPKASGRRMRPHRPDGVADLWTFKNVQEEAAAIVADIERLVVDEGRRPGSIAILARSSYRAEDLVDALRYKGLPVTDWRGDPFDASERRFFVTALSVVKGTLKGRRAHRLCDLLKVEREDEIDVQAVLDACAHADPAAAALVELRRLAFEGLNPSALAVQAQAAIAHRDEDVAARMEVIVTAVGDFETFDPDFTLDDLLAELALKSGGRSPTSGGGIRVATLHKTKGLEWPDVYLIGLEEGHLPDYRADEEDITDERRTCFVGVCRAEDRLIVSYSKKVNGYPKARSRFLDETGLK